MKSIKCLLLSWLAFSQSINHEEKTPFFITLIVMTTDLCSAACHFIASKAEETTLLYFNSMSNSTSDSSPDLSSSVSSCQLQFTSPSLGKTGGRGQTIVWMGWCQDAKVGGKRKKISSIKVIETNLQCHCTDIQD